MNENIKCFILISETNGETGRELQNICNALSVDVVASQILIEPSKNDYFFGVYVARKILECDVLIIVRGLDHKLSDYQRTAVDLAVELSKPIGYIG